MYISPYTNENSPYTYVSTPLSIHLSLYILTSYNVTRTFKIRQNCWFCVIDQSME